MSRLQPLVRPWTLVAAESRPRAGAWVVAAAAFVAALGAVVGFTVQRFDDPRSVVRFATGGTVIEGAVTLVALAAVPAVVVLVLWGLYAGSAHLIAGRVGGTEGSIRRTAGHLGWVFLADALDSALEAVGTLLVSPSPPASPADNPAAVYALETTPLMRAIDGIQFLVLCWGAVLVVTALADAHDLSRRQAAVAGVVPLVVTAASLALLVVNPRPVVIE